MAHTLTITQPMVLVPVEEYLRLIKETGEKITPQLRREIKRARIEFKQHKTIPWKTLKNELKLQY